ncbi:M48 family metallopeptidase [Curvibacter sp. APW13]|uniref:M48 family metallopeptidase n=1 Tax=Curvibacter sp. APW13 TaxID=3077236 RepID=UPI0028E03C28|nr:M48 family metallopeptidase [Curvibacter sp. APW13]MDT8990192.1 M48 family metallopeptidase [Curvibacter sp. APW13]
MRNNRLLPAVFVSLLLILGSGAALSASEREGVDVGKNSVFTKFISAEQLEQSAAQQYHQLLGQARDKNALALPDHPQLRRLQGIARKIIPFAAAWNPRATQWRWEVNLLGSSQVNAFCMPGGKIAFYTGILDKLKLTDDEVAMVMGHEIAHALREHARERMGKNAATNIGTNLLSQVLGLGQLGQTVTHYGAQLLTLEFSREDESEADLVGMELAARAGFNPRAGISLWQKMATVNKNAPPQWLSTHPSSSTRIREIQDNLPKVEPLYQRARGR